jgi:hypothetical protein
MRKTFQVLCKKDSRYFYKKNNFYEAYRENASYICIYTGSRKTSSCRFFSPENSSELNINNMKNFNDCFYTIIELRSIKLKKVQDGETSVYR